MMWYFYKAFGVLNICRRPFLIMRQHKADIYILYCEIEKFHNIQATCTHSLNMSYHEYLIIYFAKHVSNNEAYRSATKDSLLFGCLRRIQVSRSNKTKILSCLQILCFCTRTCLKF